MKNDVLGMPSSNSRVKPSLVNDMRGYTELWQYVKVAVVKISRSIKLTRATILVEHKYRSMTSSFDLDKT